MTEKRQIKVKFVDFWNGFVPEDSLFYRILAKHYEVVLCEDPEYLFCSTFGDDCLRYDGIRIFYSGENQFPDLNLYDYALGFEYLTAGDRYLRFPHYLLNEEECRRMERKHENVISENRKGFCSFVYSNPQASRERDEFFDALSGYRQVSSGGRHRNNVGKPVEDKLAFLSRHKFDIAFENSSHPGYTTEKLVQSFASGAVPVYWGDPLVGKVFNPAAFIDCNGCKDWSEVVEKVKAVDSDDSIYMSMLKEPALLDTEEGVSRKTEQLEEFLTGIIERPFQEAFRRDRVFWGKRYEQRMAKEKKAYRRSPAGIASLIYKKTLWRWRRRSSILWNLDKKSKKS